MSLPFISRLPASARAVLPIIHSGVRRGLSSRAIERSIRNAGMKISRSRGILPAMRAIQQLEQQGNSVRFVAQSNRINTARLPPAITGMKRRYSYRVKVSGISEAEGPLTRYLQVSTDNPNWTRAMIEDKAREYATGIGDSGQLSDVEVTLEHGQQDARFADFAEYPSGEFRFLG